MQQNPKSTPKPFITLGEIYYVLFKHKWIILVLTICGMVSALIVGAGWPVVYRSDAKLFIRYVQESKSPIAATEDADIMKPGGNLINTELEILTSLDLAREVAATITPERILAEAGGGMTWLRLQRLSGLD